MVDYKGAFIFYHTFRRKPMSGQIAVLFTLMIALMFLLVVVTANIGKVALVKLSLSKAADGAAVQLASNLASYATYLREGALDGHHKKCDDVDLGDIFKWVVEIFLALVTGQWWLIPFEVALEIYGEYQEFDLWKKALKDAMAGFQLKQQLKESAVSYALSLLVDDKEMVTDEHDIDQDGDTTDEISRFGRWYIEQRLIPLQEDLNDLKFMIQAFVDKLEGFNQYLYVTAFVEEGGGEVEQKLGLLSYLKDEFIPLLDEIEKMGFDLTFFTSGRAVGNLPDDEVDGVTDETDLFFKFADGLIGLELEDQVSTYEVWSKQLYNPDKPEDATDFYEMIILWPDKVRVWMAELNNILSYLPDAQYCSTQYEGCHNAVLEGEATCETDYRDCLNDVTNSKGVVNPPIKGKQGDCESVHQECLDAAASHEQDCLSQKETCDNQAEVRERIYDAFVRLTEFQNKSNDFSVEIMNFMGNVNPKEVHFKDAVYSWQDYVGSDGTTKTVWHHVMVTVSDFDLPEIEAVKDGLRNCARITKESGGVTVTVARYDQDAEMPGWWRFRYRSEPGIAEGGEDEGEGLMEGAIEGGVISHEDYTSTTSWDPKDPNTALWHGIWASSTAHYDHNTEGNEGFYISKVDKW